MAPKILFVLTSHNKIDALNKPSGWYVSPFLRTASGGGLRQYYKVRLIIHRYLPEFAHPYYKLAPHCDVTVVSPAGGEAPLDQGSVEMFKEDAECQKFLKEQSALWKNTKKLEDFKGKATEFDAIFYVGGHGRKLVLCDPSLSPISPQLSSGGGAPKRQCPNVN